jgi:hypothetical protein
MILIEAVINIKPAFFLNFQISLRSKLRVNNTRLAGKRYREAIPYKPDEVPEIIPAEFNRPGRK